METKKKTKTSTAKKKKGLEKVVEDLEEITERIDNVKKFEKRVEEKKQSIKEDLQSQLISQNKFGKQFEDMIDDYIYLVELKEMLQHDIDLNGIRYKTTGGNGFKTYKPNESCERLLKTNAQMLKILQDLELKSPDEGPKEGEGDDLL